jgi:hypothetical protein
MKFGKRRWEAKLEAKASDEESPAAPVAESWTVRTDPEHPDSVGPPIGEREPEPVVEGEAVELPITEVGADDAAPVADEPLEEPVPDVAPEPETEYTPVPAADIEPEPEPVPAPEPVSQSIPPARALGEPLPPPGVSWAPSPPPPMPFPVAEEPVLVYTSGSESPAVTPLAETGEAYASGHASGTSPSWPEPVVALAAERPEVVVGAAFAGGLLLAMILRRLGN